MQDIILYIVCTCAMLLMLIIPPISTIILRVTYASCKKKKNKMGLTGRDVAEKIMNENGLVSIYIVETKGTMTDIQVIQLLQLQLQHMNQVMLYKMLKISHGLK